ncbi:lipopolysaccharide biosynthesis protein [Haloglomus litoreum]|uniref:lipopolysaccharide biosynthesis protein n=1 Tax=Haloglomus litoreum TaxID=3034026 RepID=UPI0023E80848|nr:lipopolysaccharide biosynthesis protein [Haloglomus sp. DT116]
MTGDEATLGATGDRVADAGVDGPGDEPPADPADARLADALERVAHGAVVSVPGIVAEQALRVAFTAALTNGFSAAGYGVFVLARRLQQFLLAIASGARTGLSRFLPNADTGVERDLVATFGILLTVAVAAAFGAGCYLVAPSLAALGGRGDQFVLFLRVFALGLPASAWLLGVTELLRGLEEVTALTVSLRLGFPLLQVGVAVAGVVAGGLLSVGIGVLLAAGLVGVAAAVWLGRERGLRPRLRGPDAGALRRRYLRYTAPTLGGTVATSIQHFGFYVLLALFLDDVAGAVFAVGALVGLAVRLPLMGINQFMPPVAAALHGDDAREALARLYGATSRLVLVGVTALAVPVVVFRASVMRVFGPTFVRYADLLPAFVLAQWVACVAGSVGILLLMTDNQRASFLVNASLTGVLTVIAVPVTLHFGLPGLAVVYLLMLSANNIAEVGALYRLEGLQPLTRAHARPLVAAVPLTAATLAARTLLPGLPGVAVGTIVGLAAYAAVLWRLGFAPAERRLVGTLAARYREALRT